MTNSAPAAAIDRAPLPREPRNIGDITPAPPQVLSTLPYDRSEHFSVWKARISSLSDVGLPDGKSLAEGFEVEYMNCNMAEVVFNSGYFGTQTFKCLPRRLRRPAINHWFLFHMRSGEAWFETGERRIHARPGAIFLISLDDDFRGRIRDYDGQLLILPREAFAAAVGDGLDRLSNILLSGSLIELLCDYLRDLETRVVRMSPDELGVAGRATVEMIATCVRPSLDRLEQTGASLESALSRRARIHIQKHLHELDLTPEHLANQLGISRSKLYRAFEDVGGVTGYIQRQRLHAAHAELASNTDKQVQEIAYRYGFNFASDFARAFRREFGYSPREARNRQRR
ncbi:AraC family transcriptional regulator [Labrys miyagiensis]|uniref:AraC family transcriptional regulator n=1 Tax=Labrys miyagiensis TaxID=346912 RepID=A0ABQ6CP07_9HYPH|nr:AraC family transcriptional regulator [Labrys miyagiensis]